MTIHVARVLIDACLLVKGNVANVLFDLNYCGLISLHWTPEIAEQFVKNWSKTRVALDGISNEPGSQALYAKAFAKKEGLARERLAKFEEMQPEWRIPAWSEAGAVQRLPPSRFRVGKKHGVHEGDYTVALAAAELARHFPAEEIWLATENQKHLPPGMMAKFRVWSITQGKALETLFEASPVSVLGALRKMRNDSTRPKLTKQDIVNIVKSPSYFGMPQLGEKVDQEWDSCDLP